MLFLPVSYLLYVTNFICYNINCQQQVISRERTFIMNNFELCPRFEKAISILSQRWTALILYQLLSGPQRFCTMTEKLGVSGKTLTERLKDLEQQGFVIREVYPETPVRIEYSLTDKGMSLTPIMQEIEKWSREWIESSSTQ